MIAGPTNSLILADEFADPEIAAADLVGCRQSTVTIHLFGW